MYAHYIGKASWKGRKIISEQISKESSVIFDMLVEIFSNGKEMRSLEQIEKGSGVSNQEFTHFLEYAAQVLFNCGNFKSFGDTKFIPRITSDTFAKIIKASGSQKSIELFKSVESAIFDLEKVSLGYPCEGHVSGFYTENVTKADIEFVQEFLEKQGISALNTRLYKNGNDFLVKVASAESKIVEFDNIKVEYGDFSSEMTEIADLMEKAIPHAANPTQKRMLEAYVESFRNGSIEAHKESQREWIKDMGPVVESNIGFVETYRDPAGTRAEWEGFVAVVNKEMTLKFEKLVNSAADFIKMLPWPKEFEKDEFKKPDFTSLEVVSFATSGSPPLGINIPNYDCIRQTLGFKNVSLGNVLNAKAASEKITFIQEKDLELFEKWRADAFEVQVGLHELLGHGSGKLLSEESSGKFNFSDKPISPITREPITTWYKPGETWGSVFKSIAASYEECRAECVAMYLCVNEKVMSIFGHEGHSEDVMYISWLTMARAGLTSLEFYDPNQKKWGQAHMQARFAILRVFMDCGLVKLNVSKNNVEIEMDRSLIKTAGVAAIGEFLMKLNVYKATADYENGSAFYNNATSVDDSWSLIRTIVLENKQPRKIFVQGNTQLNGDSVEFIEYEASIQGLIQSVVDRE